MDGDRGVICHLQCEITSVSVTGLGGGGDELFLRCHVPAGGGRTIQIDSRGAEQPDDGSGETTTTGAGAVLWRDVASLSCDGSPACVRELVDRGTVVFEVRRRRGGGRGRAVQLLGKVLQGSELVGRAEVPCKDAADVAAVERWVELAAPRSRPGSLQGEEVPAAVLSARMSVRVSETPVPPAARRRRRAGSSAHARRLPSGCEWSLGDEDVFAAVACAADDAFE